jgi:hypothetical protein
VKPVNFNEINDQSNKEFAATAQRGSGPAPTEKEETTSKRARRSHDGPHEQQLNGSLRYSVLHLKDGQRRGREMLFSEIKDECKEQEANAGERYTLTATEAATSPESDGTPDATRRPLSAPSETQQSHSANKSSLHENKPEQREDMCEPVTALVSSTDSLNSDMLRATVSLGSDLPTAHLDTCATHCFISNTMSTRLRNKGWPEYNSNIKYAV